MSSRRKPAAFALVGASLVALFALGAEGRSVPNRTPRVYAPTRHALLAAPLAPSARPPLVNRRLETLDPWTGSESIALPPPGSVRNRPLELQDPWTGAGLVVSVRVQGSRELDLDDPWR